MTLKSRSMNTDTWLLKTPDSSTISALRYNPSTEELYVKFKSEAVYVYYEVSVEEFTDLTLAESRGSWFSENIRDIKDYEQVK